MSTTTTPQAWNEEFDIQRRIAIAETAEHGIVWVSNQATRIRETFIRNVPRQGSVSEAGLYGRLSGLMDAIEARS